MMRHESDRLWALAAGELELDDRRYVELHLQDCPECRDALEAVEIARGALESAKRSSPSIDWLATDERVGALVEKRLRASARPRWIPFVVSGALVAAAAGLAFLFWPATPQPVPPSEPPLVQLPEPMPIRVEVARGLTRVGSTAEPVVAGETLKGGDVLRTSVAGKAFVHLPDSSHLRVAAGTQVALTRVDADDVALTLSRGRIAVRASHESRKGFVVHAGDLDVHVVGTVFSVANGPAGVEVAVSEGEVRVASSERGETTVKPGQRLSIDQRGRARLGAINQALERELSEVQGIAEAVTNVENRPAATVVPAAGGRTPQPPSAALPRLSAEESQARLAVVEPPASAPAPAAAVAPSAPPPSHPVEPEVASERWDGPGTAFPSLAGGYTRGVPFGKEPEPTPEGPPSELAEWAAAPKPQPVAPAAIAPPTLIVPVLEAPPVRPTKPEADAIAVEPFPKAEVRTEGLRARTKSLEQLFFEKAEESLTKGGCDRFLTGLEDIAIEGQEAAQYARVLRARCFDAQLRPRQAMSEYTKYLEAYPKGRYADEARAALGQ
jgi:ferric-dicitrate binding protein FerR (iron transport regulator)